ncbi:hypothetical protein [Aeoliella sp.]|uniref:hypothetical protein n=1 Tax=Aeoliella sp. TaxID=2795800 RepID=UPI003CCC4223
MPQAIRYSLKNFLLFTGLVAAVAALYVSRRQLLETESKANLLAAENAKYIGQLSIEDPKKPHAVAIPDPLHNTLRWRWRVYLPPERQYQVHFLAYSIPENGDFKAPVAESYPRGRLQSQTMPRPVEHSGELLVDLAITHCSGLDSQGRGWWLAINGEQQMGGGFRVPEFRGFPDYDLSLQSTDTAKFEVGEPIPLLVARYTNHSDKDRPGTVPGFALVLEDTGLRRPLNQDPSALTNNSNP